MTKHMLILILLATSVMVNLFASGSQSAEVEGEQILNMTIQQGTAPEYQYSIAKFAENHPRVKIKTEEIPFDNVHPVLMMKYSQKLAPDLAMIFALKTFAASGMLEDLTDRIKKWEYYDKLVPGQLERIEYGGKLWALTQGNMFPILFYNIDLLEKAGLPASAPATWEELERACQKIKDAQIVVNGKTVIPLVFPSYRWFISPFIFQAGGKEINDNATEILIDNPASVEGMTFAQNLIKKGYSIKPEGEAAQEVAGSFVSGWSAFYVGGFWTIPSIIESGIRFNTSVLPGKTKTLAATTIGGNELVIIKTSKNKDLAWEYLKSHFTPESDKAQMKAMSWAPQFRYRYEGSFYEEALKEVPALKYSKNSDFPSFDIAHYSYIENPFWWAEGGSSWQAAVDKILISMADVKSTLSGLKQELQPKLDEFRAKH